jgi:hypothetical protein
MNASIWTEQELQEQINAWKQALLAASSGKSYSINNRALTAYDLPEIRNQLEYLRNELALVQGKTSRGLRFVRTLPRR